MSQGTCTVDGCPRVEQLRRGMCGMHYLRWQHHGSTDKPLPTCPKGHRVADGHCAECVAARPAAEACSIDDCTDDVLARGWCRKHYLRWRKYGDTGTPPRFQVKICSVGDCDAEAVKQGWCAKHHMRWKRTGTTDDPAPRPTICSVEGCGKPHAARGWCKGHYKYFSRTGVEQQMRRYALQVGSQVGPVDYEAILAEHGMVCHICGGDIPDRESLNFDHVIPLSRGGPHVQENILPSHKRCNISKGNKLMSELAGRG